MSKGLYLIISLVFNKVKKHRSLTFISQWHPLYSTSNNKLSVYGKTNNVSIKLSGFIKTLLREIKFSSMLFAPCSPKIKIKTEIRQKSSNKNSQIQYSQPWDACTIWTTTKGDVCKHVLFLNVLPKIPLCLTTSVYHHGREKEGRLQCRGSLYVGILAANK